MWLASELVSNIGSYECSQSACQVMTDKPRYSDQTDYEDSGHCDFDFT